MALGTWMGILYVSTCQGVSVLIIVLVTNGRRGRGRGVASLDFSVRAEAKKKLSQAKLFYIYVHNISTI